MKISPGSGSIGSGRCAASPSISTIMPARSNGWTRWGSFTPATASAPTSPAPPLRKHDWPRDPDGAPLYPGTCRDKPRRAAREVLTQAASRCGSTCVRRAALRGRGCRGGSSARIRLHCAEA